MLLGVFLLFSCRNNENKEEDIKKQKVEVEKFSFRKTNWGMTIAEVKKSEDGTKLVEEKESNLIYDSNISNRPCIIYYNFSEGKLTVAGYILKDEFPLAPNKYIEEYNELRKNLTEKYGITKSDTIWYDKVYKDDKEKWGDAVFLGQLKFDSFWKTEVTYIGLSLFSQYENGIYHVINVVTYVDKNNQKKKNISDY